jgi:hypothetical protein
MRPVLLMLKGSKNSSRNDILECHDCSGTHCHGQIPEQKPTFGMPRSKEWASCPTGTVVLD